MNEKVIKTVASLRAFFPTFTKEQTAAYSRIRRTSHEVRGLKYFKEDKGSEMVLVAPHTRCVD